MLRTLTRGPAPSSGLPAPDPGSVLAMLFCHASIMSKNLSETIRNGGTGLPDVCRMRDP